MLLRFSCAVAAGVMACALTQPLDMIKTQAQLSPRQCPSFRMSTKYVYKVSHFTIGVSELNFYSRFNLIYRIMDSRDFSMDLCLERCVDP